MTGDARGGHDGPVLRELVDAAWSAEVSLLTPAVRCDDARVAELLHPDFVEIGRSGRLWSAESIRRSLADEDERAQATVGEEAAQLVGPSLVLLTYRLSGGGAQSRHSSLWDLSIGAARLRFHQGTPIPDVDD